MKKGGGCMMGVEGYPSVMCSPFDSEQVCWDLF
jgi:hypothetical protein